MFSAFFNYKITLLLCPNLRKNTYILFLIVFNYQYIMFFFFIFCLQRASYFRCILPNAMFLFLKTIN